MENKNNVLNIWAMLACLFLGIVIGLLVSPAKNGVMIGCNSGNYYNYANKNNEENNVTE